MMVYRDIESWDSSQISAWFICERLNVDYSRSMIADDLLLIPDRYLNTKFCLREIIAQLHSTIKNEITETKLSNIKTEFRWLEEEINRFDLEDITRKEISQNADDTVYAVRDFLYAVSDLSDEDWVEEARESINLRTLSWADTFSYKYQLDQLDNVIYAYNQCPLKCDELERDFLRLFASLYANTACYDFFLSHPALAFRWDIDLTLSELESGYFVIDKAKVLSKEKYTKRKKFPVLAAVVNVLLWPSLIFLLFLWYFDFSSWNTPEFWLSLLASLLCGDLREGQKAKIKEIIAKNEKDLEKRTLRHFEKVNKLLHFATLDGQILIDDLLHKSLSVFKFESHRLSMPDSVRLLLKEKKHRRQQLVLK